MAAYSRIPLTMVQCLLLSWVVLSHATKPSKASDCSEYCHEENCHAVTLRYGKYCGVGHGGCPGQEPCDEVDACCKVHDDCVTHKGLLADDCHAAMIMCMKEAIKKRKNGFSTTCPWSLVVPVMSNAMELAMAFGSGFGKAEL